MNSSKILQQQWIGLDWTGFELSYLSNEVVGLADEHDLVGLVVSEPEALVGVAPREVAIGVSRNEDLVLLDGVDHPVAMLDLTDWTFQLLVKERIML